MRKYLTILLVCLLVPMVATAEEYRAIVEAHALSKPGVKVSPGDEVLHVYRPGETVVLSDKKPWSRAASMVILPGGEEAFVPSHKITNREDLAAERDYYEEMAWDDMSEEDLFYWAIYKGKPVFGHACFVALSGGTFKEKDDIEGLCRKVRQSREVREATEIAEKAMKAMDEEDRQKLLSGGAPIGAPKAAVYLSWGKPSDTKRTITKDVVAEQIIYDDRVAYIENGVLTMIQE